MKILIVFNHPAPYKVALFNGLSAYHDVHVIFERFSAKNRHKDFYNEAKYDFTLHKIKGVSLGNENHFSLGVKRHLKKHKYDLIIMNGYSTLTEMIALRYLKQKNIPYAFYINGGIIKKESALLRKIKHYFISGAKLYFSPAPKANEYLEYYGAAKNLIHNYPYSTVYQKEVATYRPSRIDKVSFWQSHYVQGNNFTICVTSYIKRKNNTAIIRAWKNVPPDHSLILVGEGPELKHYQKIVHDLKLENVYFLPFAAKELIAKYLKHSDNAVYLSNYDIYGHVINEALAAGLNVLTNKNMVAAHELINHDKNGLFASDNISESLNTLFTKDYFLAAINSAVTIEDSLASHLEILEKLI